jgi:hypothetical protein
VHSQTAKEAVRERRSQEEKNGKQTGTRQRKKRFEKGAAKETIKNTAPPALFKRSQVALFYRSVSATMSSVVRPALKIATQYSKPP